MLDEEREAGEGEERPTTQKVTVDDLDAFLRVLPPAVRAGLEGSPDLPELMEVILDLGRPPLARFRTSETHLADEEVTEADIAAVTAHIGPFGDDNRAGIERTLHRISCFRNRTGRIVGLTCRVGRAVYGTIAIIEDLVTADRSVLLLGRPGSGRRRCSGRWRVCWPTTPAGGWSWSTRRTRSRATGTSPTPPSAGRGGCRCAARRCSTR